jgi:hypothetical protein
VTPNARSQGRRREEEGTRQGRDRIRSKSLPVDALERELSTLACGSPTMSARDLAQAIFRVYGPQVGEALRDILNKYYPMSE